MSVVSVKVKGVGALGTAATARQWRDCSPFDVALISYLDSLGAKTRLAYIFFSALTSNQPDLVWSFLFSGTSGAKMRKTEALYRLSSIYINAGVRLEKKTHYSTPLPLVWSPSAHIICQSPPRRSLARSDQ